AGAEQRLSADLAAHFGGALTDRFAPNVTNPALLAGIAPGPSKAFVEQVKHFSGHELAEGFGIVAWRTTQQRVPDDHAAKRFGIMRRNDASGERDVGEVVAVGVV